MPLIILSDHWPKDRKNRRPDEVVLNTWLMITIDTKVGQQPHRDTDNSICVKVVVHKHHQKLGGTKRQKERQQS